MLLLAFTAHRLRNVTPNLAELILQGELVRATHAASAWIERLDSAGATAPEALEHAAVGRLLGQCLLACGRTEEAEELFRQMLRCYERISKGWVRSAAALDQASLAALLNKPGRAAEIYSSVADDSHAEHSHRIEAMLGSAIALHRSGECKSAWLSLDAARRLGDQLDDAFSSQLIEAIGLELAVSQRQRGELEDHALCTMFREGATQLADHDVLHSQLEAAARAFKSAAALVAHRMTQLAHRVCASQTGPVAAAHAREGIEWLRQRRMSGYEVEARVESALSLISRGAVGAASELLAPQNLDEQQVRRSSHAMELQYCLARISMNQGRHADALRLYRMHTQEAVAAIRNDASRRKSLSYLEAPAEGPAADPTALRLPLRYRKGYKFILDHLHDENLSVHDVALHLGVTERALQLAFRNHLGMTPAQLIRERRMERIRDELCAQPGDRGVLETASRWGIKSRTTLVNNYRHRFAETPTQTLQGDARQA